MSLNAFQRNHIPATQTFFDTMEPQQFNNNYFAQIECAPASKDCTSLVPSGIQSHSYVVHVGRFSTQSIRQRKFPEKGRIIVSSRVWEPHKKSVAFRFAEHTQRICQLCNCKPAPNFRVTRELRVVGFGWENRIQPTWRIGQRFFAKSMLFMCLLCSYSYICI